MDFGVLQKSSKQFLSTWGGGTPLPVTPPARHFVPRTRAKPLFMTIHAPPPPVHQILDPPLVMYMVALNMHI